MINCSREHCLFNHKRNFARANKWWSPIARWSALRHALEDWQNHKLVCPHWATKIK